VLGQCAALVHLDLTRNDIGPNGEDFLAGVLGQCTALAYLDVDGNYGIERVHDAQQCRRHFNRIKVMLMKREQENIRKDREEKEGRKKQEASR